MAVLKIEDNKPIWNSKFVFSLGLHLKRMRGNIERVEELLSLLRKEHDDLLAFLTCEGVEMDIDGEPFSE